MVKPIILSICCVLGKHLNQPLVTAVTSVTPRVFYFSRWVRKFACYPQLIIFFRIWELLESTFTLRVRFANFLAKNSSYHSYLRFAPNDLLLRRLCIPRGNSGTSHSALGSQWLIPLHLISGRPRPLLSPFEHSSLGTPYEKK